MSTRDRKQDKSKMAAEVLRRLDAKEPQKSQRTLFLNTENYKRLEAFAEQSGRKPSHIIDELVALFLEQIELK